MKFLMKYVPLELGPILKIFNFWELFLQLFKSYPYKCTKKKTIFVNSNCVILFHDFILKVCEV